MLLICDFYQDRAVLDGELRLCTGCLLWVKVINLVGELIITATVSAQFIAWKGVVIVLQFFIKIWWIYERCVKI